MAVETLTEVSNDILNHKPAHYNFSFNPFLLKVHHHGLPPDRPICRAYATGHCPNGTKCLERHVTDPSIKSSMPASGLNSLVCKHWLRGLCKKGEQCEFLHEYNLRKMPECNFFARNGYCSNGEECLYLHIDPQSRLPPCPHYDRGFCPLGPICSKKHVRRNLCNFYLAGFCPEGKECKEGVHAKWVKDLEPPTIRVEKPVNEDEIARRMEMAAAEEDKDRARDRDREDGRFRRGRGGGGWRGGRGGGGGGGGNDRRFHKRGH